MARVAAVLAAALVLALSVAGCQGCYWTEQERWDESSSYKVREACRDHRGVSSVVTTGDSVEILAVICRDGSVEG